LNINS